MKYRFGFFALIAAAALAAIAGETVKAPVETAPATKEEPAPLFENLDANNDDYLTKEEARHSANVRDRFKELDIDRDGKISRPEFKEVMQPKVLNTKG